MPQSLSQLLVHVVFHVKNNLTLIRHADKNDLYAYMGGIINCNGSIPIVIGGTADHVHILCMLSKNMSLAKLTEEVKRHSSRWIKTRGHQYASFAWQAGYAGFSVSPSLMERTKRYIENQEEHHKISKPKQELRALLNAHKIAYNEKHLWDD